MTELNLALQDLQELANKRDTLVIDFTKQLLIIAVSLLGLLVSLHSSSVSLHNWGSIAFCIAIVSISGGILCSSTYLFSSVSLGRYMVHKQKQDIIQLLENPFYKRKPFVAEPKKLYKYAETASYILYLISLIALSSYAFFIA
ncbi:MAG: hypothetical protein K2X37_11915 [Chitinophagaceae bacterium]|nr:hypothetical protein [Chitinophagaceae bacterium]